MFKPSLLWQQQATISSSSTTPTTAHMLMIRTCTPMMATKTTKGQSLYSHHPSLILYHQQYALRSRYHRRHRTFATTNISCSTSSSRNDDVHQSDERDGSIRTSVGDHQPDHNDDDDEEESLSSFEKEKRQFLQLSKEERERTAVATNRLVRAWLESWRDFHRTQKKNATVNKNKRRQKHEEEAVLWPPRDMLQFLEENLPSAIIDSPSLLVILDGVMVAAANKKKKKPKRNKRDGDDYNNALFGAELLRRIVQQFRNEQRQQQEVNSGNNNDMPANDNNPTITTASAATPTSATPMDITYAFHKVMNLYCRYDIKDAEQMLDFLEETNEFPVTNETYTIILSAWARRGAARDAERILLRILERHKHGDGNHGIVPTKDNFESCLRAWVVVQERGSGQRAELLLLQMQDLYQRNIAPTQPCVQSFSKVVAAWANSRKDGAPERADAIVRMMGEMDWSTSSSSSRTDGDNQDITSPTFRKTMADTYLQVMKLWSFSGHKDAPERCQELLGLLDQAVGLSNFDPRILQKMYAALIFTWARSRRQNLSQSVQEIVEGMEQKRVAGYFKNDGSSSSWDPIVYHAILRAYSDAGDGEKAEFVLKQMLQQYQQDPEVAARPDTQCFNFVLLAWSRSKGSTDGPQRAVKLFNQMLAFGQQKSLVIHPDVVSYNAVLASLVETADQQALKQVDEYIMKKLREDPNIQPTQVTYKTAILVGTHHASGLERAESLMREMIAAKIEPDRSTFKAYFKVVYHCPNLSEAQRQRRLQAIKTKLDHLRKQ